MKPEKPPGAIRLFCGGLDKMQAPEALEQHIRAAFNSSAEIFDVFIKQAEGQCLGYGFVTFTSEEQVRQAGLLDQEHRVAGMVLDFKEERTSGKGGKGGPQEVSSARLFVGGLPKDCDDSKLRQTFESFGRIKDVFVMKMPDGTPKGFGFVEFSEDGPAQQALASGPHLVDGREVNVRSAEPKPVKGAKGAPGGAWGGGWGGGGDWGAGGGAWSGGGGGWDAGWGGGGGGKGGGWGAVAPKGGGGGWGGPPTASPKGGGGGWDGGGGGAGGWGGGGPGGGGAGGWGGGAPSGGGGGAGGWGAAPPSSGGGAGGWGGGPSAGGGAGGWGGGAPSGGGGWSAPAKGGWSAPAAGGWGGGGGGGGKGYKPY
eukprot:TRINITY_DN15194_c0_g1_i2.p1 TRINITY_DN15194_c0_g1~~TRINITY_DN15194_c0_g1_i2.p1  ORF type:complete len:403 (+),score=119.35 TRINITY_DN15194_c0_g1_i2:106-1209(+)